MYAHVPRVHRHTGGISVITSITQSQTSYVKILTLEQHTCSWLVKRCHNAMHRNEGASCRMTGSTSTSGFVSIKVSIDSIPSFILFHDQRGLWRNKEKSLCSSRAEIRWHICGINFYILDWSECGLIPWTPMGVTGNYSIFAMLGGGWERRWQDGRG